MFICPSENTNNIAFRERLRNNELQAVGNCVMNGAVTVYSAAPDGVQWSAFKLSMFSGDRMIHREADERKPSNHDNVSSRPDEGVAERHNTGSEPAFLDHHTEYRRFREFHEEAGMRASADCVRDGCGAIPSLPPETGIGRTSRGRTMRDAHGRTPVPMEALLLCGCSQEPEGKLPTRDSPAEGAAFAGIDQLSGREAGIAGRRPRSGSSSDAVPIPIGDGPSISPSSGRRRSSCRPRIPIPRPAGHATCSSGSTGTDAWRKS